MKINRRVSGGLVALLSLIWGSLDAGEMAMYWQKKPKTGQFCSFSYATISNDHKSVVMPRRAKIAGSDVRVRQAETMYKSLWPTLGSTIAKSSYLVELWRENNEKIALSSMSYDAIRRFITSQSLSNCGIFRAHRR